MSSPAVRSPSRPQTDTIRYLDGSLRVESVRASEIAESFGTPVYAYSANGLRSRLDALRVAFGAVDPQIRFAVKALSNLSVLRLLVEAGAGLDVVSGGELERAWLAGAPMERVAFAGVGKTDGEIRAALDGRFSPLAADPSIDADPSGRGPVGSLNAESVEEIRRIGELAHELGVVANVCVRVNPDIDPHTHEYTTTGRRANKFGIPIARIPSVFEEFASVASVHLHGLHVHLGSPIYDPLPLAKAARAMRELAESLRGEGHAVDVLDLGGGLGADYQTGQTPSMDEYAKAIVPELLPWVGSGGRVMLEPGRSIAGESGVLLTRVTYVKLQEKKRFIICDAGMHTLIRPSLYRADHFVWPTDVETRHVPDAWSFEPDMADLVECDVVGPVCETADFLARDRALPPVGRGDLIAVFTAGAYGMTMSSTYNEHTRPPEVLVDGDSALLIRRRQPLADLLRDELAARPMGPA